MSLWLVWYPVPYAPVDKSRYDTIQSTHSCGLFDSDLVITVCYHTVSRDIGDRSPSRLLFIQFVIDTIDFDLWRHTGTLVYALRIGIVHYHKYIFSEDRAAVTSILSRLPYYVRDGSGPQIDRVEFWSKHRPTVCTLIGRGPNRSSSTQFGRTAWAGHKQMQIWTVANCKLNM